MVEDKDEALQAALDRGTRPSLPESEVPGWLGEKSPDLRKTDDFEPSLNAGLLQENTPQTRWLFILVLYLLVIPSPVAFWMLWRDRRRSTLAKAITTVVALLGYAALFWAYGRIPA